MKDIILQPTELADVYALKTLYDYVKDKCSTFKFKFENDNGIIPRFFDIIKDAPTTQRVLSTNEVITVHSDITNKSRHKRALDIDISILKNAVKPATLEQKLALRKAYGVSSDKPILVLSYLDFNKLELHLLHSVKDFARIFIVGYETAMSLRMHDQEYLLDNQRKKLKPLDEYPIRCITERGVLRDYYAMADVAVNGANLTKSYAHMHNFVEATEGGPLFMVKPRHTDQFGYTELTRAKAIRSCKSFNDLMEQLTHFLKNFDANKAHLEKRARHLEKTRDTYLPLLARYVNYTFRYAPAPNGLSFTGLLLNVFTKQDDEYSIVHLRHPKTNWGKEFSW